MDRCLPTSQWCKRWSLSPWLTVFPVFWFTHYWSDWKMTFSALQIRLQHSSKMNLWFITHIPSAFMLSHFLYVSSSPQNRFRSATWTCTGRFSALFHYRKTSVLGTSHPKMWYYMQDFKDVMFPYQDSIPWMFKHVSRHCSVQFTVSICN